MGQRLNIEIKNNEKILANCYYHWSGYSISSLEITKEIIEYINKKSVMPTVNGAIEVLIITGATFNEEAWEEAKKMDMVSGEFPGCNGRNNGLIGVDEKSMKKTREWEEGRIEINIEQKTFSFKCAWEKDYIDYPDIWERVSDLFYKIKNKDISSIYRIPFDQIDLLISGITEAEKKCNGRFCINDNYCFDSIY